MPLLIRFAGNKQIHFIYQVYLVRIHWKLSEAPANVNFPLIARAQTFKQILNVRAAFIVSAKLEPQGALIAHLSTMSTSVIS